MAAAFARVQTDKRPNYIATHQQTKKKKKRNFHKLRAEQDLAFRFLRTTYT